MAERQIMITIGADGKAAIREMGDVEWSARKLTKGLGDIAVPVASILSIYAVGTAVKTVVGDSLKYLGQMETANLGIASSFMVGGKYIDQTTGKVLQGSEALRAAQVDSAVTMEQLQIANMQTIATLDQLVKAYQETLPVAMSKGFNRDQVQQFTTAMVQAAGAIGLRMDQLGEETRSLLTGAIDPRTSRIAMVLGLRNEDIKANMGNADQLFSFLMTKLDAYKTAGMESQKTWDGLWSNTKDIALQAGGKAFQPLFESVKYELSEITRHIVTIDDKTKKINWDPDFVSNITSIKSGLTASVAEAYRFSMLLDKAGGTLTAIGYVVSGGPLTELGKWFDRQNKMFEKRYLDSDKALQALADREAGVKKAISATNTAYEQNAAQPDVKEQEKARKKREAVEKNARDISMILTQAAARDALIGKTAAEKELLQLDTAHQQEIKRLKDLHASKQQLQDAADLHTKERADLSDRQDRDRRYQQLLASAKIAEQDFQNQAQWLDKLDQYKLKTGGVSEEAALANRYERERQILALKQQTLGVEIEQERDIAKRTVLEAEYWRIQQQITQSTQDQANETDLLIRKSEQLTMAHRQNMAVIASTAQISQLQFIGQDQAALDAQYAFQTAALQAHYEEQIRLAGQNHDLQLQAENAFQEEKYRLQTEYAQRQSELWWNSAQTYIGFAQQMTTMGLQMLLFDESQRSQIGKRMLATSIRFIAQSVQQYMFGEAKKHLITAFSTSGQITMQMAQHTASLTMLETEAVAWAAFLTALSLNPYGGQAVAPSAAAMTAVAGGVVPAAIAATAAQGAAGAASSLGMAAAWTAGGVLVGALGEAGASAIEGGTSGSTTAAGYGGGSPASPVVTTPAAADNATAAPIINVHIYGNVVDHDQFARELVPAITKAYADGVR